MTHSKRKYQPVDLSLVKRYDHVDRKSIANLDRAGRPAKGESLSDFFDSLPDYLKAADLKKFISHIILARNEGLPFHLMAGAHVIKVGLSPILIDLMQSDLVTGISLNSAGLIHDLEMAFFGATSEDVQAGLEDGSFGMVRDTACYFAECCAAAQESEIGLGAAAGELILKREAPYRSHSLLGQTARLDLPATIHVGIGTDIVAQHPEFDGAAAGAASHRDFRLLCDICADIDNGGVVANIGSAVILPEVFLKALTVARNLKGGAGKLTTANFDMISHYRPMMNVVTRPTKGQGKGYNFIGHHEIMIPLLAAGLGLKWKKQNE